MKQPCLRILLLALPLMPAFSCLTPEPAAMTSPDEELEILLSELEGARGGFDGDETTLDGGRRFPSATELELARALRQLAFEHPRHVPTLVANAAVAFEANDFVGAQRYLDQALRLDPTHVSGTLLRVRIAAEQGNLPFAMRRVREQLEQAPDDPRLRETLAGIHYLLGDFTAANEQLDLALALAEEGENEWRIEYHRGLIAEGEGDNDRAREHYRRSQDLNPEFEPSLRRWRWLSVQ